MSALSITKAVILGIVQGATEFLPVSSSGHLVIAQDLLGVRLENGGLLALDVCLHIGTLMAVVAVFWRDILHIITSIVRRLAPELEAAKDGLTDRQARRLGLFIIVGTVPTAILGPAFKDFFERLFTDVAAAAAMLLVTGAILFGTRFARDRGIAMQEMKWWHALGIGIAQAIAIIPGISRSGSTISGGLYLGVERQLAARFSFLLSIPAIAGAAVLQYRDFMNLSPDIFFAAIVGTVMSAIVGFVCIKWLLRIISHGRFSWFAYYCWAAGLATLAYLLLR